MCIYIYIYRIIHIYINILLGKRQQSPSCFCYWVTYALVPSLFLLRMHCLECFIHVWFSSLTPHMSVACVSTYSNVWCRLPWFSANSGPKKLWIWLFKEHILGFGSPKLSKAMAFCGSSAFRHLFLSRGQNPSIANAQGAVLSLGPGGLPFATLCLPWLAAARP